MILRVLPEARGEAIEAAIWYEECQRSLGEEFLGEIETAFDRIRQGVGSLSRMEQYSGSARYSPNPAEAISVCGDRPAASQ